jgi:hypothetical protein
MRFALAFVLIAHALIHLMGFAKAFGYAQLPQLAIPISRPMGVVWLLATVLLLTAAAALWVAPHAFWLIGGVGVVVSQVAIVASWGDARFGTLANVVVLIAVAYGAFAWGPFGLRADYMRHASRALDSLPVQPASVITEPDLAPLPALGLIDPAIRWRQIDDLQVEAIFTHGPKTRCAPCWYSTRSVHS